MLHLNSLKEKIETGHGENSPSKRASRALSLLGLFLFWVALSAVACTKTISYPLEDNELNKPPHPVPLRLMVARLTDSRSEEEKSGNGKARGWTATSDSLFEDIPEGITRAMIEHLRRAALFTAIESAPYPSSEVAQHLQTLHEHADLVLRGTIKHFYGIVYRKDGTMAESPIVGGPVHLIGGLIFAGIESTISKEVEGEAVLAEMELINSQNGNLIWKGEAGAHFKRTVKGIPEPPELALEALKVAVAKLVDQLRQASLKVQS